MVWDPHPQVGTAPLLRFRQGPGPAAYAGRNPASVALIDELARFAGIRVIEYHPLYLNIPHDSPCFAGFNPGKHVEQADVGLLVDVDVPWIPTETPENPGTFWAHIDVDTVKGEFPMWGFPSNLRIGGDSARILAQLLQALKSGATAGFRDAAARRVAALEREHAARKQEIAKPRRRQRKLGAHQSALPLCRTRPCDRTQMTSSFRRRSPMLRRP